MLSTWREGRARFAFDLKSVRSYDQDGRLHVSECNISKANVCPYYGREVPDAQSLGLDPNQKYMLLRDPDELRRAANTFNNLPLLSEHVPVDAADHHPELVIGSTGTDAEFAEPYLKNSLVIWAKDAIRDIEANTKREISCGYRYVPVMEPGHHDGERYDGRMTQIVGNHVAMVREGRVGPDVIVGDEAMSNNLTPEEALRALASNDDGKAVLMAETSVALADDPRLNAVRARMTPQDFASLLRMIRTVREHFESLASHAQDRMPVWDTDIYQLTPHDAALCLAFRREIARIAARAPIAQDAAAKSFAEMFGTDHMPLIIHY